MKARKLVGRGLALPVALLMRVVGGTMAVIGSAVVALSLILDGSTKE